MKFLSKIFYWATFIPDLVIPIWLASQNNSLDSLVAEGDVESMYVL